VDQRKVLRRISVFLKCPLRLATFKNNEIGLFGSKEVTSLAVVGTISKKIDAMAISDNAVGVWAQMRGLETTQMVVRAIGWENQISASDLGGCLYRQKKSKLENPEALSETPSIPSQSRVIQTGHESDYVETKAEKEASNGTMTVEISFVEDVDQAEVYTN
jgi:hypothetical protein